jgi:hypothetical protein
MDHEAIPSRPGGMFPSSAVLSTIWMDAQTAAFGSATAFGSFAGNFCVQRSFATRLEISAKFWFAKPTW